MGFVGNPRSNPKAAQSLAQLDTSQTERLEISYSDPLSGDLRQVLLSMRNLRRFTLYLCQDFWERVGGCSDENIERGSIQICQDYQRVGTILKEEVMELRKHVSRVKNVTGIGHDSNDGGGGDEEV